MHGARAIRLAQVGGETVSGRKVSGARGWSDKCAAALLLACDEIASLRAGLSEACDELADALEYLTPYHRAKWGYDATLARLRALLPSDAAPRATLDRMTTIPTLETHCKIAISATGARAWSSMTETEQTDMKARIRGLIDYAFGASADGAIYALGPSDPPPTQPPT